MKKIISFFLVLTLLSGLISSCAPGAGKSEGKLRIVTTIFPVYDWCREILGDRAGDAELTMLLDSGVDLHSYQPTAADMVKISSCDVFIYVGGESDEWAEDALQAADNPDRIVVNLLESLGDSAKEEEIVEGMEAEEEGEEEGPEYDEHVWLSLRNAAALTAVLADALSAADPENASSYRQNASAYAEKLNALDARYAAAAAAGSRGTVLFGDRFPFRYLTDDYGLSYYAAFAGCSAETEASFETIVFLAGKADELGLSSILTIESSDGSIARTIRDNTAAKDQQILILDSMQSMTAEDVKNGVTYLSVMETNLAVLAEALK